MPDPTLDRSGRTMSDLLNGVEPNERGMWSCPVGGCEVLPFPSKQGLIMHLVKSHGVSGNSKTARNRTAPEPKPDPDSVTSQVRTQLRELSAPLREQMAEIEKRLVGLQREQRDLREAKRQIESVLSRLEDSPAQKSVSVSNGSEARAAERKHAVEEFIASHRELLEDGFTMQSLVETMKEQGAMSLTTKTMFPVIEELRDAGVIRAERVVRGGGMQYRLN